MNQHNCEQHNCRYTTKLWIQISFEAVGYTYAYMIDFSRPVMSLYVQTPVEYFRKILYAPSTSIGYMSHFFVVLLQKTDKRWKKNVPFRLPRRFLVCGWMILGKVYTACDNITNTCFESTVFWTFWSNLKRQSALFCLNHPVRSWLMVAYAL